VYVESEHKEDVQAAFMRTYRVTCVPADEHHDLISYANCRDEKLLEGSWVRFRHGEHKGDLAIVISESQTNDSVSVATIPRIPMGLSLSTGKRQRPAPVRAALFDPKIVEMVYGRGSVTQVQDRYRFKKRTYLNGLLLLDDQAVSNLNTEPHPSLDEVIPFREAQLPAIKNHCMDTLKWESIRNVWQRGDCVQVSSGELSPLQGRVESLDFEVWSAAVQGNWTDDNKLSIQDIPLNCLERRIFAGDSVLVVAGRSKERCRIVVSVSEGNVMFVDYGTKEEVRPFCSYHLTSLTRNLDHSVSIIRQVLCQRLCSCPLIISACTVCRAGAIGQGPSFGPAYRQPCHHLEEPDL
jgi:transcription elongation factor